MDSPYPLAWIYSSACRHFYHLKEVPKGLLSLGLFIYLLVQLLWNPGSILLMHLNEQKEINSIVNSHTRHKYNSIICFQLGTSRGRSTRISRKTWTKLAKKTYQCATYGSTLRSMLIRHLVDLSRTQHWRSAKLNAQFYEETNPTKRTHQLQQTGPLPPPQTKICMLIIITCRKIKLYKINF
jgi:hypothetical protein